MSQTKAQRKKQQKKKARQQRARKNLNIQRGSTPNRYRLDVFYDGGWRLGVKYFNTMTAVNAHCEKTEQQRRDGIEIIAGKIIDTKEGRVAKEIEASPPKVKEKGGLPDVLEGKQGASKGILGGLFGKK